MGRLPPAVFAAESRTDLEGVNLMSDDNLSDVNDITGALKSWFRELPEPLMTFSLYHGFVDAASA